MHRVVPDDVRTSAGHYPVSTSQNRCKVCQRAQSVAVENAVSSHGQKLTKKLATNSLTNFFKLHQ